MGEQVGEQAGESNIHTSVHFLGLRLESGEEKQLGSGVARFHHPDIFSLVGCHILQVPQPFQTIAPARDKAFKFINLWGKHFTFKFHSI